MTQHLGPDFIAPRDQSPSDRKHPETAEPNQRHRAAGPTSYSVTLTGARAAEIALAFFIWALLRTSKVSSAAIKSKPPSGVRSVTIEGGGDIIDARGAER